MQCVAEPAHEQVANLATVVLQVWVAQPGGCVWHQHQKGAVYTPRRKHPQKHITFQALDCNSTTA